MNICALNSNQIETWYESELKPTFIQQERKPLEVILKLVQEDKYQVLGVFEETESSLIGYATFAKSKEINLVLLDYLGVTQKLRNKGVGGEILKLAADYFTGTPMVLESELPVPGESIEENNIRERRLRFYERNGFVPVYEMATCGLRWQAFIRSAAGETTDIEKIMKDHKALYGEARSDVVIPLDRDEVPPKSYWDIAEAEKE